MIVDKGYCWFGFFKGMGYNNYEESFDTYRNYRNDINKGAVIRYIKRLEPALTAKEERDIFFGKSIPVHAGMYADDRFLFPTDFLYYYEKYDIGIPPEYEGYLVEEIGIR